MTAHTIQRILVPTDMNDFATLALDYALLLRRKLDAQITLMYAEEFEYLLTAEYPLGCYFDNTTAARNHARRKIEDPTGVRVLVLDDSPARAIVRTADDINADLIIMGTHGRHAARARVRDIARPDL